KAVFQLKGLPVGNASIFANAYGVTCDKLSSGLQPTWYSEPQVVKISANSVTQIACLMIHNGQVKVGIDFDDNHGPGKPDDPVLPGGTFSSQTPYLIPMAPGVKIKAILTTGDSPNTKPGSADPYRMVGIPDGLGAFDNGDGTFTLLSNHELTAPTG